MYQADRAEYPKAERRGGLMDALADQDACVEKLQATVGDLANALEPILRPADPEMAPDLTEAMPHEAPATGRLRGVERRVKRIQQTVSGLLERLDA